MTRHPRSGPTDPEPAIDDIVPGSAWSGSKPPTMTDVARRVGVSRQLVSLVLRDAPGPSERTRERVRRAARELGYLPHTAARVLRRNRSKVLGVLFTLQHPFHCDLVEALHPVAEEYGYTLILGAMSPTQDDEKAVEAVLSYRSEALVIVVPDTGVGRLASVSARVPITVVGRPPRGVSADSVHVDDARGARLAVDHLAGLGHRAIVHITGGSGPGASQRRRGYRAAMRRHGLAADIRIITGDYTEESGARAAYELLRDGVLPTAVVAANDRCALGLIDAFLRAGITVPHDVSVVGYDDSRPARMSHIALTTVRQDTHEIADAVMRAVVDHLDNGRSEAVRVVLPPRLVVRGTTAPARVR